MWEHRNQINSSGLAAQNLWERAGLWGRVHQEFIKGRASLNPEDRDLLGNQQAICKWSNPEIQDWLEKLHHARAACSRRVDTQARDLLHSQRCMARWLATVSHTTPDPATPPEAVEPPSGPAASTHKPTPPLPSTFLTPHSSLLFRFYISHNYMSGASLGFPRHFCPFARLSQHCSLVSRTHGS